MSFFYIIWTQVKHIQAMICEVFYELYLAGYIALLAYKKKGPSHYDYLKNCS